MVQVVLCQHGCMKQNDKKEMQFCLIFSVIYNVSEKDCTLFLFFFF